jgi:hypothetical protein
MNAKRIVEKLRRFWFEPAPATRLAMLRIMIGAFVVWYLVIRENGPPLHSKTLRAIQRPANLS